MNTAFDQDEATLTVKALEAFCEVSLPEEKKGGVPNAIDDCLQLLSR
jgi:hypothetical protein